MVFENKATISRKIKQSLIFEIFKGFRKARPRIRVGLRLLLKSAIESSSTYQSLQSDKLLYHFGLTGAGSKLSRIISVWADSIEVEVTKPVFVGNQVKSMLTVVGFRADWTDVLSLRESTQITELGKSLEWLKWLLAFGDKTVIGDYAIKHGEGRSGPFIMAKSKRGWAVPGEFSGVTNKNWITEIIKDSQGEVENIIIKELERSF
jgi:hypothetical protein